MHRIFNLPPQQEHPEGVEGEDGDRKKLSWMLMARDAYESCIIPADDDNQSCPMAVSWKLL